MQNHFCTTFCALTRALLNLLRLLPSAAKHGSSGAHEGLQQEQRQDRAVERENLPRKKNELQVHGEKTGREVTAYKFECILLGEQEGVYMYGFVKGSTQNQINDAVNKFKDGQVFQLSKIILDTWTSTNSISSPKPFRLNLHTTKSERIAADEAIRSDFVV